MLQNKFELPLDLAIKPSNILKYYLTVVFVLSLASLLAPTSLSAGVIIFLIFLLLVMTGFMYKSQKYNQVNRLKVSNDGEWELEVNNKIYSDLELGGECIVTNFIIWLNFSKKNIKRKRKIFHVLLFPDSSDKDLLRQLRVRLRFLKATTAKDAEV